MNKIALITGASKGIGFALAKKMLNENFSVIGTSRDGNIKGLENNNFYSLELDLSSQESIDSAHKKIFKNFKQIDFLILEFNI